MEPRYQFVAQSIGRFVAYEPRRNAWRQLGPEMQFGGQRAVAQLWVDHPRGGQQAQVAFAQRRQSGSVAVQVIGGPAAGFVMPLTGTTTVWCMNSNGAWPVYFTSSAKCW